MTSPDIVMPTSISYCNELQLRHEIALSAIRFGERHVNHSQRGLACDHYRLCVNHAGMYEPGAIRLRQAGAVVPPNTVMVPEFVIKRRAQ
jgi:hypothetical protein